MIFLSSLCNVSVLADYPIRKLLLHKATTRLAKGTRDPLRGTVRIVTMPTMLTAYKGPDLAATSMTPDS
jgi:hypothetical protein